MSYADSHCQTDRDMTAQRSQESRHVRIAFVVSFLSSFWRVERKS